MLFLWEYMKHLSRYIFIFLLLLANSLWAQSFVTRVSSKTMGKKDLLEVQYIAENLDLSDFYTAEVYELERSVGTRI